MKLIAKNAVRCPPCAPDPHRYLACCSGTASAGMAAIFVEGIAHFGGCNPEGILCPQDCTPVLLASLSIRDIGFGFDSNQIRKRGSARSQDSNIPTASVSHHSTDNLLLVRNTRESLHSVSVTHNQVIIAMSLLCCCCSCRARVLDTLPLSRNSAHYSVATSALVSP